jgi:trehalose 6-phosphate phosphatase
MRMQGSLRFSIQENCMGDGPDAVIFDLDGVITFTAHVHAAAWKKLFDDYLRVRAARMDVPLRPFDAAADYYAYVDGKPRYDGVQSFLKSRAIEIPYGSPSDSPGDETICGLGNRKDDLFTRTIDETGVEMDAEAVRFAHDLRNSGIRVGLASSSRNAVPILKKAGILSLFHAIVDGLVSERLHLRGKPEPDIFLECLAELGRSLNPKRAAVVEDAISGVEAGLTGGFALVLGVDRHHTGALEQHGANWVISHFREITADRVSAFFTARARAA